MATFFNQIGCRFRHTQPDSKPCKPILFLEVEGCPQLWTKNPSPRRPGVLQPKFPLEVWPLSSFPPLPSGWHSAVRANTRRGSFCYLAPRWEVLEIHLFWDPFFLNNRPLTQGSLCFFLLKLWRVFCLLIEKPCFFLDVVMIANLRATKVIVCFGSFGLTTCHTWNHMKHGIFDMKPPWNIGYSDILHIKLLSRIPEPPPSEAHCLSLAVWAFSEAGLWGETSFGRKNRYLQRNLKGMHLKRTWQFFVLSP